MRNLFRTTVAAIFGPARTRKVRKTTCRVGLNVENLGERVLLSVSPIHALAVETPTAIVHSMQQHRHGPKVPDVQYYTFTLISSSNKPTHTLVITSETYLSNGSAFIGGTWAGDGPNSHVVSGTLAFAAHSKTVVDVNFSWTNGNGGQNSFSGTMTQVHSHHTHGSPHDYYLTGTVTTSNGGGPGMVSGYGYPQ